MKHVIEFITKNPWIATIITGFVLPGVFAAAAATWEMYKAHQTNSAWGESSAAIKQAKLLKRNITCTQNNRFTTINNPHNIQVGSIVCPTGDVLIRVKRPEDQFPVFKIVSVVDVIAENEQGASLGDFFIRKAHADGCSQFHNHPYYVPQYYTDASGQCVRYFVYIYSGQAVCSEWC